MNFVKQPLFARLVLLTAGLALASLLGAPAPAAAQGRLDAKYEASLAGIPVGRGGWTIEISEDSYSAAAQGGTYLWA